MKEETGTTGVITLPDISRFREGFWGGYHSLSTVMESSVELIDSIGAGFGEPPRFLEILGQDLYPSFRLGLNLHKAQNSSFPLTFLSLNWRKVSFKSCMF